MARERPEETPEQIERRMLERAARVRSRTRPEAPADATTGGVGSYFEDFGLSPESTTARARLK